MAVTTKKLFPATSNATTTVFSPVGIQLNNQDDLDVYVTLSGGTRVLQLRQSTGSTAQSSHPQVNNTDGLYFPAVTAGTTLYNYTLSTDNNTITFNSALPSGAVVFCERRTRDADSSYTTFASGSTIRATDLNNSSTESNFTAQDGRNKAFDLEGKLFNGAADSSIKTKLDGIEDNATADQTASEIRALVESASDSNVFTDADHSKLNAIEAGATADQTASEIRTLVESASDSNVFTDADHSKLDAIEASATADQTAAEIRTLVEAASDSNVFTDADHSKLNAIEASATADQTAAEIRTLVESASDSNVFTDADHSKLNAIEASADVTDATNVDAAGAVMNSDLATKGQILVGDGSGDPTVLGVGSNNMVLVADSSEAAGVKWATVSSASGFNNVVEDTTPQLGGNLDVQASEINTSTTNGNIKLNPNGTGVVEIKGDGSSADGTLQLNCSQNSHGVKIKSPAHSAAASYTLTLPTSISNGQFLKTDASGNLSWGSVLSTDGGSVNGVINAFGGILLGSSDTIKFDSDDSNAHHISVKGPLSLSSTVTYTLPEDGTNGQALVTNGSGVLSFSTIEAGAKNNGTIFENLNNITTDYTISANSNAFSMGPMTITNSTITVGSGETYTIIGF